MNLNKPTLNSRLIAIIIDLFIYAASFFALSFAILRPALHSMPDFVEANKVIEKVYIDSGLYYEEEGELKPTTFKTSQEYEVFFRDMFIKYNSPMTIEEVFKEFEEYFTCANGVCTPVDNEEKMIEFYEDYMFQLSNNLLYSDEEFSTAMKYVDTVTDIQLYAPMALLALVYFVIIPSCSKYGKTIGMRLYKVAIVNGSTGYTAKRSQIILRYLILVGVEAFLSIFLLGIPALISISMMVFSKQNITLHDYFAVTMMVNHKEYDIFDSKEDYETALLKIQ